MTEETASRNAAQLKDEATSSNIVQLEFEPFDAPPSHESAPPKLDEPPLEAYAADEGFERLTEYDQTDQPQLEARSEAQEPSDPQLNVPFVEGGRWQVVDSISDGTHTVLLATDDPHEAQEARAGYDAEPGHQVRVFDASTGAVAIEEIVMDSEATLRISEDFQSALSAMDVQSDHKVDETLDEELVSPAASHDSHVNEPIEDLAPDEPSEPKSEQQDKWISSKVSKSDRQKALPSTDDDLELEDDQIFTQAGTGQMVPQQGRAMGYGVQSNLGALTSAAFSGIKGLFSRTKHDDIDAPGPEELAKQEPVSGVDQSFEKQFNAGDLTAWRSSSQAREMAVLSADMAHSLDAVRRLAETPYSKFVKELDAAVDPITDAQKARLAQLKEQPEVTEAISDINAFIGDVQARSVKLADDNRGTPSSKAQLEQSLAAWSHDMDEAIKDIPDPNLQKDLMDRIKKLIELIIERFSPSKSKGAAPSM